MDASTGSPPTLESLLEHADWVRALARNLVRDLDRADDVVQDTWMSALESPPRDARNPRGWLGAMIRHWVSRTFRKRPPAKNLATRSDMQRLVEHFNRRGQ